MDGGGESCATAEAAARTPPALAKATRSPLPQTKRMHEQCGHVPSVQGRWGRRWCSNPRARAAEVPCGRKRGMCGRDVSSSRARLLRAPKRRRRAPQATTESLVMPCVKRKRRRGGWVPGLRAKAPPKGAPSPHTRWGHGHGSSSLSLSPHAPRLQQHRERDSPWVSRGRVVDRWPPSA